MFSEIKGGSNAEPSGTPLLPGDCNTLRSNDRTLYIQRPTFQLIQISLSLLSSMHWSISSNVFTISGPSYSCGLLEYDVLSFGWG